MKILIVLNFETGDSICRYWQELVVADCEFGDIDTIEDAMSSYIDNPDFDDDAEYDEVVRNVMNASGFDWFYVSGKVPECDCMRTIYV